MKISEVSESWIIEQMENFSLDRKKVSIELDYNYDQLCDLLSRKGRSNVKTALQKAAFYYYFKSKRLEELIKSNNSLTLQYDNRDDFDYYKKMALDRIETKKIWYVTINKDLLSIDEFCKFHNENVKLEFDEKKFIIHFSCCT